VRPDAYGRWREGSGEVEFFLEFDFGTEGLGKLAIPYVCGGNRTAVQLSITSAP
jgi:Replication-relaxation